jgi:hypothetical protein
MAEAEIVVPDPTPQGGEPLDMNPEETPENPPMTEAEIKSVVGQELGNSLGQIGSEVSAQRRMALEYYHGKPFGNEVEGRSQVVLTDVADTIEWILPTLMRMFTGGSVVARYQPKNKEDVEMAEQATQYVNHVFQHQLDGFMLLYEGFKDALLEKNAVWKTWYEELMEPRQEIYRQQDEAQLQMLEDDPQVEIVQATEGQIQGPDGQPMTVFDVVTRDVRPRGRIRCETIPPEEFLIARRATKLDDKTAFAAHRLRVTVSDLIAMGIDRDLAESLPADDAAEYTEGRIERRGDDESFPDSAANRRDDASREVWLNDCYLRIDEDNDGYAELREILCSGEMASDILFDQEVSHMPFASITPVPMPHKFHGLSFADLVMDLQLIRSTILRNILDNLYITNNQRYEVVDGAVEIDDLLTSRPGGVVRVDAPGMVNALDSAQLGPMAFNTLEYLHEVKENRTGITRYNQGMDASSLNQTATGITQIMGAAQARVELVGRIFAETGLKRLFRNLLRLVVEAPMKEQIIRLRGKWVTFDPGSWNADMDCEIEVGLGVGQTQERVANLQLLAGLMSGIRDEFGEQIVTAQEVYEVSQRIADTVGFKTPETFFLDPTEREAPPPPPNPEMVKIEVQQKIEEDKLQLARQKLAVEAKKAEAEIEREAERLEVDKAVRMEQIESTERTRLAEIESRERIANKTANRPKGEES